MAKNISRYLDLSELFSDEKRTIFGDSIHFASSDKLYSLGDRKMAEAIADYMHTEGVLKFDNECSMDNFW